MNRGRLTRADRPWWRHPARASASSWLGTRDEQQAAKRRSRARHVLRLGDPLDHALAAAARGRRAAHPRLHHRARPRAVVAARRADRGRRDRRLRPGALQRPRRSARGPRTRSGSACSTAWYLAVLGSLLMLGGSARARPAAPSARASPRAPASHLTRRRPLTDPNRRPIATSRSSSCARPRPPRWPPPGSSACGDKIAADQAAVDAMRLVLGTVRMDGVVVIGEGEKDEAPMLYNGEQIGDGSPPAGRHRRRPAGGHDAGRQGHAERAGRDRAVRARDDVRPGPDRLHGEARRRRRTSPTCSTSTGR